jgi:hypothetical protein
LINSRFFLATVPVERVRAAGVEVEVVSPADFRHFGIAYGAGVMGNLKRQPWRAALVPAFLANFARAPVHVPRERTEEVVLAPHTTASVDSAGSASASRMTWMAAGAVQLACRAALKEFRAVPAQSNCESLRMVAR